MKGSVISTVKGRQNTLARQKVVQELEWECFVFFHKKKVGRKEGEVLLVVCAETPNWMALLMASSLAWSAAIFAPFAFSISARNAEISDVSDRWSASSAEISRDALEFKSCAADMESSVRDISDSIRESSADDFSSSSRTP